jgi:cytidyltransferase-like protein
MKKIIIVSGFYDPLSFHHLKLFEEAKKLGDYLIVGLNSDECSERKKGQPSFMPF